MDVESSTTVVAETTSSWPRLMGLNPAFMVVAKREHTATLFSRLAQIATSDARSRLSLHLPWTAARSIQIGSRALEVGVKGWHGWANDEFNCHSFHLRVAGEAVPCDLSIFAGERLVLVEIRAATNGAAEVFFDDKYRRNNIAKRIGPDAEAVCFDNETGGWELLYPANRKFQIKWSQADLDGFLVPVTGSDPVIDIDPFGELLLEMISI